MNCKDVENIIKKQAMISPEIEKHLESCPSCTKAAESSLLLRDVLKTANEKNITTPFDNLKTQIENSTIEKETFMSKVKEHVKDRPKLMYGLGLAMIVFLFITLVPFSYTITDGCELRFDGSTNISHKQLGQALAALGFDDISVKRTDNNIIFADLPNKNVALKIATTINFIAGLESDYIIEPLYRTVSGSLYAQVKDKIKVEVDVEGKTSDQIAEEIRQQLIDAGFSAAKATVTAEGEDRKISLSITSDDSGKSTENVIDILLTGEDDIAFELPGEPVKLDIDMEGKTDAEIIAEVKAKLAAQGEPDADVTINTTPDGKKEINVSVEKEEKSEK